MRSAPVLVVLLFLVLVVSTAFAESYVSVWEEANVNSAATSSWFGSVGMIVTPTANTTPAGAATASWHRVKRDAGNLDIANINCGITKDLEIGGANIKVPGSSTELIGNVKYQLHPAQWLDNPNFPEMAVGAFDVTNQLNRAFYIVLSKRIEMGAASNFNRVSLHLGFADNKLDSGALDGLFGGMEFMVGRATLIQAEYDAENFNCALRFSPSSRLSLDVGSLDGDFGFGATYRSQF